MASEPSGPDRHINIQVSPEMMAGVYSNFANVSHSDYEFTITFARVDHEVEGGEVPGIIVSRVSLSPRFMQRADGRARGQLLALAGARGNQEFAGVRGPHLGRRGGVARSPAR